MKGRALVRGGATGGTIASLLLLQAGRALELGMEPWSWSSTFPGYTGTLIEWTRAAAFLLPAGLALGMMTAWACGFVFEYVTRRSGWLVGAVVGLLLGTTAALVIALIPWAADWLAYSYTPPASPAGPHDPAWLPGVIATVGVAAGAMVGGMYGVPDHASREPGVVRWRQVYPNCGVDSCAPRRR